MRASACYTASRHAEGLELLSEALDRAERTQELWFEAELHRLRGEAMCACARDLVDEAENCFHQALDVARRQQAKSLELRAAISLSRLWREQGKRAQAAELLATVCGWFGDGFETVDLQEAKVLLRGLQ